MNRLNCYLEFLDIAENFLKNPIKLGHIEKPGFILKIKAKSIGLNIEENLKTIFQTPTSKEEETIQISYLKEVYARYCMVVNDTLQFIDTDFVKHNDTILRECYTVLDYLLKGADNLLKNLDDLHVLSNRPMERELPEMDIDMYGVDWVKEFKSILKGDEYLCRLFLNDNCDSVCRENQKKIKDSVNDYKRVVKNGIVVIHGKQKGLYDILKHFKCPGVLSDTSLNLWLNH